MRPNLSEPFFSFFSYSPALFFGLLVALGSATALYPPSAVFFLLVLPLGTRIILQSLLIVSVSFVYTVFNLPESDAHYEDATFTIKDFRPLSTPFSKLLIAHGVIKDKTQKTARCSFRVKSLPKKGAKLHFDSVERKHSRLIGTPDREIASVGIPFAHYRYHVKKSVLAYIAKRYEDPLARGFLQAVTTGFSTSTLVDEHFARCGLSHILAVSGFHFSLFLAGIYFLFFTFFGKKSVAFSCALFASLLNFYFGETASVLRAYEMSLLLFFGMLIGATPKPLNLLGIALICSLTLNPLSIASLGFQLSFSATLGLLLVYPLFRSFSETLLPKKPYLLLKNRPVIEKVRYYFARIFLFSFLLTLSATLATMPILLAWFHFFPLASLLYNLFIPPLLALSILLFLISIFLPFLHVVNGWYLTFVLTPLSYQPEWTMKYLVVTMHPLASLLSLTLLFGISIFYSKKTTTPLLV